MDCPTKIACGVEIFGDFGRYTHYSYPHSAVDRCSSLAAGVVAAVEVLLAHDADADRVDVKAQTPLFVAMVNQHWKCAE